MTVVTIIDQVLKEILNISATDADNTATRAKALNALIEVAGYVFNYRDWRFRWGFANVTVAAGEWQALLPADFLRIGDDGGVFLLSTGCQLDAVSEQEILAIQAAPGATDVYPDVYCVLGLDTAGMTPTYRWFINIPPNAAAVALQVNYHTTLGTLDESTNANNILLIPAVWHQQVLIPGLRAFFRQNVGDGRYQDFRQDGAFRDALKQMVKWERHGDDTTRSMPSFFGS